MRRAALYLFFYCRIGTSRYKPSMTCHARALHEPSCECAPQQQVFCLPVPDELRSRTHISRSPTHVTNRGHPLDRAPPSSETTDELREEEDRRTQFSGYFSSVFHRCSCIASCWDRIGTEVVASRSRDGIPLSSVLLLTAAYSLIRTRLYDLSLSIPVSHRPRHYHHADEATRQTGRVLSGLVGTHVVPCVSVY
jgi:hypothetical protein